MEAAQDYSKPLAKSDFKQEPPASMPAPTENSQTKFNVIVRNDLINCSSKSITALKKEAKVEEKDVSKIRKGTLKKFNVNFVTEGICIKTKETFTWDCIVCQSEESQFSTMLELILHVFKNHSKSLIFQCNICEKLMKDSALSEHFFEHSELNLRLISSLDEPSSNDEDDNVPLGILFPENSETLKVTTVSCPKCDQSFQTEAELTSHLKINHKKLSKSRKIATLGNTHLCSYCGKIFPRRYILNIHYRVHSGEKPFKCSVCGKGFSIHSNLKRHKLVHTGEKPFLCTQCGKSFNQISSLKTHVAVHNGEKPHLRRKTTARLPNDKKYACEHCQKMFSTNQTLKIHLRTHTKERPYQCATCGKTFTQKICLTQHLLNHTGEKPHKCEFCRKSFKIAMCLKSHLRTHTGERPYKCSECDMSFASHSNLYRHRVTHTGLRRFSCDTCGKKFSQRIALSDHMNIHTGARPYTCPYCPSSFANQSTHSKHVSKHVAKNAK